MGRGTAHSISVITERTYEREVLEKKPIKQQPHSVLLPVFQDIAEANFRTSSSRLLAAVMSALCNTSVKLTSILPIAYDGEVLLRSLVKQVSTENDSALAHRFPLLVAHMEKLSHVSKKTRFWYPHF